MINILRTISIILFVLPLCFCSSIKNSSHTKVVVTHEHKLIPNETQFHTNEKEVKFYFLFTHSRDIGGLTPKLYFFGPGEVVITDRHSNSIGIGNLTSNTHYIIKCRFKESTKGKLSLLFIWEGKNGFGDKVMINITHI